MSCSNQPPQHKQSSSSSSATNSNQRTGGNNNMKIVNDVGPTDILCGRDSHSYSSEGNRRFRAFISLNYQRFMDAQTDEDKCQVINKIINLLKNDVGAKFVQPLVKESSQGKEQQTALPGTSPEEEEETATTTTTAFVEITQTEMQTFVTFALLDAVKLYGSGGEGIYQSLFKSSSVSSPINRQNHIETVDTTNEENHEEESKFDDADDDIHPFEVPFPLPEVVTTTATATTVAPANGGESIPNQNHCKQCAERNASKKNKSDHVLCIFCALRVCAPPPKPTPSELRNAGATMSPSLLKDVIDSSLATEEATILQRGIHQTYCDYDVPEDVATQQYLQLHPTSAGVVADHANIGNSHFGRYQEHHSYGNIGTEQEVVAMNNGDVVHHRHLPSPPTTRTPHHGTTAIYHPQHHPTPHLPPFYGCVGGGMGYYYHPPPPHSIPQSTGISSTIYPNRHHLPPSNNNNRNPLWPRPSQTLLDGATKGNPGTRENFVIATTIQKDSTKEATTEQQRKRKAGSMTGGEKTNTIRKKPPTLPARINMQTENRDNTTASPLSKVSKAREDTATTADTSTPTASAIAKAVGTKNSLTEKKEYRPTSVDGKPANLFEEIQDMDIVCGRGKAYRHHQGNLLFQKEIHKYIPSYIQSESKAGKSRVVARIVHELHEKGCRFVKKDKPHGKWMELGHARSHEKTGHAIRDYINNAEKMGERKMAKELKKQQIPSDEEYPGSPGSPLSDVAMVWASAGYTDVS